MTGTEDELLASLRGLPPRDLDADAAARILGRVEAAFPGEEGRAWVPRLLISVASLALAAGCAGYLVWAASVVLVH